VSDGGEPHSERRWRVRERELLHNKHFNSNIIA
jgi:hypothetical protein